MKVPTCWITPGAMIDAEICATPPITAFCPRIDINRSGASTPFCSGMTPVCAPSSGLIASPALSTSHSLTQNSTISTGPTSAGLSVACVGARWVSPRLLWTLRPWLFMAARCGPRAMKVTSAPALASAAPKPPPTPPAPTTAIFTDISPSCRPLPVDKRLHHPVRLVGQERAPECGNRKIDRFLQRQLFPLPEQRLLRAQRLRSALQQHRDQFFHFSVQPAFIR